VALARVEGIEELRSLVGRTIGPTEWREVTQADIDDFARLSGDDQWIHVDVERAAKESPFGTTVAHGNLTLSLIDGMRRELLESTGFALGVNYGWNRVRFPAPVPAGACVRASVEAISVASRSRSRAATSRPAWPTAWDARFQPGRPSRADHARLDRPRKPSRPALTDVRADHVRQAGLPLL
jgi:acyl dehydratase